MQNKINKNTDSVQHYLTFSNRKLSAGFTLIELMVAISIVGFLSSIVLTSVGEAKKQARDAQRIHLADQYMLALDLFYDKYGTYPDNASGSIPGQTVNMHSGDIIGSTVSGNTFGQAMKDAGILSSVSADPLWDESLGLPGSGDSERFWIGYRYNHGYTSCDPIIHVHRFESKAYINNYQRNDTNDIITSGNYQDMDSAHYALCPRKKIGCYDPGSIDNCGI